MHWFSRTFALAFFFLSFLFSIVYADETLHDHALRVDYPEALGAVVAPQKVVDAVSTTLSTSETPSSTASSSGGSSGGSHSGSITGGLILGGLAAVTLTFAIATIIRRRRRRALMGDNSSDLSIAEAQPQSRASLVHHQTAAPDLAFPPSTYDSTSFSRPILLRSDSGFTLIAHPLYTTSMTPDAGSSPVLSRANSAGTLGPLITQPLYATVLSTEPSSLAPSRDTSAGTLASPPQSLYPLIIPESSFAPRSPSASRPVLSRENSAISRSPSSEQIYFSPRRASRPPLSREDTNLSVHEEEDHA